MPKITLKEIAERAGVSKTAASYAFNRPEQLSEETLARILTVADELGYSPDPVARNLKRRQTGYIGILVPQPLSIIMRNPHFLAFLEGVSLECERVGLSFMLVPPMKGNLRRAIVQAAVDAFLTVGLETFRETMQILQQRDIPFVMVDSDPVENISCVNPDDEDGAYQAMAHVLRRGHEEIVILGIRSGVFGHYDEYTGTLRRRIDGYQRALVESGLSLRSRKIRLIECECESQGGYQAVQQIWELKHRPSAIVAMADILAVGALQAARRLHIMVPQEVGIVGYDDIPASALTCPTLTTVRQPILEKGRAATRLLVDHLVHHEETPRHIVLPVELVERESC
jgi:DNA-binding LacI/PurR family transcriptional regulator